MDLQFMAQNNSPDLSEREEEREGKRETGPEKYACV